MRCKDVTCYCHHLFDLVAKKISAFTEECIECSTLRRRNNELIKFQPMLKLNSLRTFVLSGAVHDINDLHIPPYVQKLDESLEIQKARLLYQSRKRGMLENGLLLSSFADKYLGKMTAEQVQLYDRLINLPSNDWDLFYWATGVKPVPTEFDNEIMKLFQDHVKNKNRKSRICQPNLTEK